MGRSALSYLLDTHTWIWLSSGTDLSRETQRLCREASEVGDLFLSPISIWEAGLKASRGRFLVPLPVRAWLSKSFHDLGVTLSPFDFEVASDCADLPPDFHGDPADRILAATCRVRQLTLLTRDKSLLRLAEDGVFMAKAI